MVDGVWGRGWGVVGEVGGEHPVPEEEEEFVCGLGEDVSGGGTVVEEDHGGRKGGSGGRLSG